MDDLTYILKFVQETAGGKIAYIFNRGGKYVNSIASSKWIDWWGCSNVTELDVFKHRIQILAILPYDNSRLCCQSEINVVKKYYIDDHNTTIGTDEILCNQVLNDCIKNIKLTLKANYCIVYNTVAKMGYNEIYDSVKKIWWNPTLKKMLALPRYKLLSMNPLIDMRVFCVLLLFREYLNQKMVDGERLPLGPNGPYHEIHNVMSANKIMKKFKITQYYDASGRLRS